MVTKDESFNSSTEFIKSLVEFKPRLIDDLFIRIGKEVLIEDLDWLMI